MTRSGDRVDDRNDTMSTGVPRGTGRSPFVAVCKLAKLPFMFQWLTAFVFGYLASAGSGVRHILLAVLGGAGACIAHSAFTLHNALVDRDEDTINQPGRIALLLDAGIRLLRVCVVAGYAVVGAGMVVVAATVDVQVLVWAGLAAVLSVGYNAGPRLKRRPVVAEITTGTGILLVFLAGWTWHEPASDLPAAGLFLAVFVAVTTFAKDLPDAEGDAAVGAPGLFNVPSQTLRRAALAAIFVGPYCLLVGLVAGGWAPSRLLVLLGLLPMAILLAGAADEAKDERGMIGTYHLCFLYRNTFSLSLLVLQVFTPAALSLAIVLLGAQVLMLWLRLDSRFVEPELSWAELATATWAAARRTRTVLAP